MNTEQALRDAREAMEWYRDEAAALAKHMHGGAHTQAVLASLTVLSLDAGQRATKALAALSQPQAAPEEDVFSMDVINRAGILASDMPHTVVEKLRAASVAEPRRETPMTNAELQAEIGRLQQELIRRVCGDPTQGVGLKVAHGIVWNEEQR